MGGRPAVGVDHDLAPGQPGVAHRATDDELPGRVHVQEVLLPQPLRIEELAKVRVEDRLDDVLEQVWLQ